MIQIYDIVIIITYLNYFKFSYGSLESEVVSLPIDIAPLSPVLQQRVFANGSIAHRRAVTEVTISLDGGDNVDGDVCSGFNGQCLNPTVTIRAEQVDLDEDIEYLDIHYGSYSNESIPIVRCTNHSRAEQCNLYADCLQSYSPPAGCYDQLTFFVYQTEAVSALCGDDGDEGYPSRSWGLQFDIFCEAGCDTTECVENNRRRRLGAGDLVDDENHDETSTAGYDLELECKQYDDAFTGFLVFVGICWIVQCGGFYFYTNSNKN